MYKIPSVSSHIDATTKDQRKDSAVTLKFVRNYQARMAHNVLRIKD